MTSTLNQRLFGRDLESEMIASSVASIDEASAIALPPTRALDPNPQTNTARNAAIQLGQRLTEAEELVSSLVEERAKIESDSNTKPNVLRQAWNVIAEAFTSRADQLVRVMAPLANELRTGLENLALPLSDDPAAAVLARQDVDVAIQAAGGRSIFEVFMGLAQRGGDTAAAAVSAWGHDTYLVAGGLEETFATIKAAAIETQLNSEDPNRRAAAEALVALDKPVKAGQSALYVAVVMAQELLAQGKKIAAKQPVIVG